MLHKTTSDRLGLLQGLRTYLDINKIKYKTSLPHSFTGAVKSDSAHLVIQIENIEDLPALLKELSQRNLCATVIGGGRGRSNDSYSVNNLWKGIDVFIQLISKPQIEIKEANDEKETICRVSPHMMLIEINQKLYKAGYHCPTLFGCLPYMSFAGGLSTQSHTARGFLANCVEGIEVILPSGQKKYVSKKDPDFALICQSPSLGLLGVISAIDIKIYKGKKKLQRTIEYVTYKDLRRLIKNGPKKKPHEALKNGCLIFSPVQLKNRSFVKLTRWEWVDDRLQNYGHIEEQKLDSSTSATEIAPFIATKYPEMFARIFQHSVMALDQKGSVIRTADQIMGPENTLLGNISDIGLFFEYENKILKDFLSRLKELLEVKESKNKYPVNTSVFIRFPKLVDIRDPKKSKTYVAIDFTSLGQNQEILKTFVDELVSYLQTRNIRIYAHYGKSYAISLNNNQGQNGWNQLKRRYADFYVKNGLNRVILKKRVEALEQNNLIKEHKPLNPIVIVNRYYKYTDNYQKHIEAELEKQLNSYPNMKLYYKEKSRLTSVDPYTLMLKDLRADNNDQSVFNHGIFKSHLITEHKRSLTDSNLIITLKKYDMVSSLKVTLFSKKGDTDIDSFKHIEDFHALIDRKRKKLIINREYILLKWFGVFLAGLIGCVILSIPMAKTAHHYLFKTKAESMLLEKVDLLREKRLKVMSH